jgi:hypothetical protein
MFETLRSLARTSRSHIPRRRRGTRIVLAAAVVIGTAVALAGVESPAFASGVWSSPTLVDSGGVLASVSCPTVKFCLAVDGGGKAVIHKRNTTWAAPSPVDVGDGGLFSVSCATTVFCMAVDGVGNAERYSGLKWLRYSGIDSGRALDAVSCPKFSFCAAVDADGNALTLRGTTWSSPAAIDGGHALMGVACPTVTFCAAVDDSGDALTFNGTSWASPSNIDSANALDSVSCPTATLCMAVDNHGNVLTFNGTSWSSPASIDPGTALDSVSCHTANFCTAVDATGHALTLPTPIAITTTSLPPATHGSTYSATLTASGGNPPYLWSARLPQGLKLNRSTGVISGTPRRSQTFRVTVTLFDEKFRIPGRPGIQDRATARFTLTIS